VSLLTRSKQVASRIRRARIRKKHTRLLRRRFLFGSVDDVDKYDLPRKKKPRFTLLNTSQTVQKIAVKSKDKDPEAVKRVLHCALDHVVDRSVEHVVDRSVDRNVYIMVKRKGSQLSERMVERADKPACQSSTRQSPTRKRMRQTLILF